MRTVRIIIVLHLGLVPDLILVLVAPITAVPLAWRFRTGSSRGAEMEIKSRFVKNKKSSFLLGTLLAAAAPIVVIVTISGTN